MSRGRANALGVDVGGSHILVLSLGPSSAPGATATRPRWADEGVLGLVRAIAEAAEEVRGSTPGSADWPVGIAFPGAFEGEGQRVVYAPNLPEWVGQKARPRLERALGSPVRLENDANAAAWGEHVLGERPGSDLLYVSLGTGIGAGIVLDGRLIRGPWGLAGEIGHVPVPGATRTCGCGKEGCLETVAGGRGLANECARLVRERPRSLTAQLAAQEGSASARALLFAAERGDRAAVRVRDAAGTACGAAIGAALNVVGAPGVALGGRLVVRAPGYVRAITTGIGTSLLPTLRPRVRVWASRAPGLRGAEGALLLAAGR
jgi:glucokinase